MAREPAYVLLPERTDRISADVTFQTKPAVAKFCELSSSDLLPAKDSRQDKIKDRRIRRIRTAGRNTENRDRADIRNEKHCAGQHGRSIGDVACPEVPDSEACDIIGINGHAAGNDKQVRSRAKQLSKPLFNDGHIVRRIGNADDLTAYRSNFFWMTGAKESAILP